MKLRDLELKQSYIKDRAIKIASIGDFLSGKKILDDNVFLPTLGINLQRGYCWNEQQKKEFVLAFIRKIHIPPFAFIVKENNVYQVIDGKQRLNALISFCRNEFALENGLFFNNIEDGESITHICSYGLLSDVGYDYADFYNVGEITDLQKIEWFNNINFKGTPQDIEHFNKIQEAVNKNELAK